MMSGEEPGKDSFGSASSLVSPAIASKKKPPPPPPAKKLANKVPAISPIQNGISCENAGSPQVESIPSSASTAGGPPKPAQEAKSTPTDTSSVVSSPMIIKIIKVRDSSAQTEPDREEKEKSSEPEDTAPTVNKDDASDTKTIDKETQADNDVEEVSNTAVGRIYTKDGKRLVVDESKWKPDGTVDLGLKFSVMVEKNGKSKERVFLSSKYLQKLFGRFCNRKYYPAASLQPDGMSFSEPYTPLFFHYEEMIAASEKPEQTEGFDPAQIQKALAGLRYWYEKWVLPSHETVREAIKRDSIGYNDLWAVFKPGDLLYGVDDFSQPRIYVIAATCYREGFDLTATEESVDDPMMSIFPMFESMFNTKKRFVVQAWHIDWDSSARHFIRKSAVFPIQGFGGTRRITELDHYPVQFYKGKDQDAIDELLSKVEVRGQAWKSTISTTSTSMHHDGPATEMSKDKSAVLKQQSDNNIHLNERVIADNDGWALFGSKAILPAPLMGFMDGFLGGSRKEAAIVVGGFDEAFASYDRHPPSKDFDTLQAQLCPSDLFCCSIRTMKWYRVTISNLRPIEWRREAIDSLVVDGKTKRLLRGLVEEHKKSRSQDEILSDFIPDKGCGLVIVLHGPPGVGKTLTAGKDVPDSALEFGTKHEYHRMHIRIYGEATVLDKHRRVVIGTEYRGQAGDYFRACFAVGRSPSDGRSRRSVRKTIIRKYAAERGRLRLSADVGVLSRNPLLDNEPSGNNGHRFPISRLVGN
jgi:hypothetical protein